MKTVLIFTIFAVLISLKVSPQSVKTEMRSSNAQVSILKVIPDSFPNLSILFNANNEWGYPVWGITENQIRISENGESCKILSLGQVTEKLPINLVIIVDHSGSMLSDNYSKLDEQKMILYRDKMKTFSPLFNAKKAINTFVQEFNNDNDLALIIGFSSNVDLITNFTNSKSELLTQLNQLDEVGGTAFFDAINTGIDSLINKKGINIIVALTDGDDNASSVSAQEIIKKSKEFEVPIYIIGLGEIRKNILESIATATKGSFYYSKTSTSLISVYNDVAKRIKSIYEVKYVSNTLDYENENREILMEFEIDTLLINSIIANYDLPYTYIQEKIDEEQLIDNYLIGLGISILVVGIGSVVYLRYKKKRSIIV